MTAVRARLPDGRLHFQHGPIDLVIGAEGEPAAVADACEQAWRRFQPLLGELVAELALLRRVAEPGSAPAGAVARRLHAAVLPFRPCFVTPMAAVAGGVADAIVACFVRPGVLRAHVNNGGDIALHLAPGAPDYTIGVAFDRGGDRGAPPRAVGLPATLRIAATDPWRGVATSGWRGRSLSLGIADSVTVVAADGACADAAATMIANAVDVDHPAIRRAPADTLRDDSDLGGRRATVEVPALPPGAIARALDAGEAQARRCVARGLVGAATITLQGRWRTVGPVGAGRAVALRTCALA
jgi:ApbE superfamily uncharacterized protein (UPF0280 family)